MAGADRRPDRHAAGTGDQHWGITQKQTGADRLTLGGALGANIHGRGLTLRPIIGEVESFTFMDADGRLAPAAGPRTASCSASRSAATACSASSPACGCG